jgi:hypothetical protein
VNELLIHSDGHRYTWEAITIMWVDYLGDDLVNQRLVRPELWVYVKEFEQVLLFFSAVFSRSHWRLREGGLNAATATAY